MDSLQGIPVEYKLNIIQHASHKRNFMSPQNWLCRSERNPALDALALNSPLVHLNGDNAYSPQIPDTQNYMVTSKVQFLQLQQCLSSKSNEHNPSHVRRHTLPSQPSQLLITQFRLNTHNPLRVSQHQKQTQYSMLQNKTLFYKHLSNYRHLTSSSSLLYIHNKLLARALQRGNNST